MPSAPDKDKLLFATHRSEWRAWLRKNYRVERDVWLVYFKKHTGKPRIPYNDAVEEALCFGWIDSTVRTLDDERYAQRFSRRKPGSSFSQANKERIRALVAEGCVAEDVLPTLEEVLAESFEAPADIIDAIRGNETAWEHYQRFSDAYKRIRVAFIDAARDRPEEFDKRLRYFIHMTEKNRQFGFGGIEKYY